MVDKKEQKIYHISITEDKKHDGIIKGSFR